MAEVKYPGISSFSSTAGNIASVPSILESFGIKIPKGVDTVANALSVASSIGASVATLSPIPAIGAIVFSLGGSFLSKIPGVGGLFGGGHVKRRVKHIWVKTLDWPTQIDAGNGIVLKRIEPIKASPLEICVKAVCYRKCKTYYAGFRGTTMALYAYDLPNMDAKMAMVVIRRPISIAQGQDETIKIDKFKAHLSEYLYSNDYIVICPNVEAHNLVNAIRNNKLPFNVIKGTQINRMLREVRAKVEHVPPGLFRSFLSEALKFGWVRTQLGSGLTPVSTSSVPAGMIKVVSKTPVEDGLFWLDTKLNGHLATRGIILFSGTGDFAGTYGMYYYNGEFKDPAPIVDYDMAKIEIDIADVLSLTNPNDIIAMANKFPDFATQVKKALSDFVNMLVDLYPRDRHKALSIIGNLPSGQKMLLNHFIPDWEGRVVNGRKIGEEPPAWVQDVLKQQGARQKLVQYKTTLAQEQTQVSKGSKAEKTIIQAQEEVKKALEMAQNKAFGPQGQSQSEVKPGSQSLTTQAGLATIPTWSWLILFGLMAYYSGKEEKHGKPTGQTNKPLQKGKASSQGGKSRRRKP